MSKMTACPIHGYESGKFCSECGRETRVFICPVCNEGTSPLYRYCIECGASLKGGSQQAVERS
jgi:predicted amidophosphoribosyltransferase